MPSDDILTLACPVCNKIHKYELEVHRSFSSSFMPFQSSKEESLPKYFTRLFTCPNTGKDFQARFCITEKSSASIKSVAVKGLGKEVADEENEGV